MIDKDDDSAEDEGETDIGGEGLFGENHVAEVEEEEGNEDGVEEIDGAFHGD